MATVKAALTPQALAGRILVIRGQRVMLDSDLAELYEVETKRFNEQVKRNTKRFPVDFMFRLTTEEFANLRSQFATSSWGGRRYPPLVFTEHGAIMAAAILNSDRAIEMHNSEVRAFVDSASRLRQLDGPVDDVLRRFVTILQTRMSGFVDWARESGRYHSSVSTGQPRIGGPR